MEMKICHTDGMQLVAEIRNHKLTIDVPPKFNGKDTGPTPPELFVASLASCTGMYALMYLNMNGLPTEGLRVDVSWEDVESPSRIGKVHSSIVLPDGITSEQAQMVLKFAEQCKVRNTLMNTPEICVSIAERPEVCLP